MFCLVLFAQSKNLHQKIGLSMTLDNLPQNAVKIKEILKTLVYIGIPYDSNLWSEFDWIKIIIY